jgi:hypothetical protein
MISFHELHSLAANEIEIYHDSCRQADDRRRAISAVVAVTFVAASGGLYTVFGGVASQVKAVLGYTQAEINAVSAATYVGSGLLQIPLAFVTAAHPAATALFCQIGVAVGWGLTLLAVADSWPAWAMGVVVGFSAMCTAGVCLPSKCMSWCMSLWSFVCALQRHFIQIFL